ncbi:hypothetical protein VC83_01747 [Pseudogymnoascus destructans]|uniref:Uncharacterized protein n=1 Tax=Pseudogymnoascus destructans TaxID=655981 RepID=A0A177AJG1_9PEZI|nr:uncharacterized protein VC83_01747 [Pseudogymnoascus destructans]OAF61910.1 hypothetical protein VC83_01747 [Pseudogymnoascus destructans]
MDFSNFLNPVEERIQEVEGGLDEDIILQEVMAPYIQVFDAQYDDDEEPHRPVLTTQNAIQALQVLIEFSESENSGITDPASFSRSLERVERQLVAKQPMTWFKARWMDGWFSLGATSGLLQITF